MRVVSKKKLNLMIELALRDTGLHRQMPGSAINLVFVSKHQIRRLNQEYLNHAGPTDVIAFDLRNGEALAPPAGEKPVAAEIYICPQIATEAANRYQTSPQEEIALYIVHGLLHLAGYRDHSLERQREMRAAEQRIMARLKAEFKPEEIIALDYKTIP